MKNNRTNLKIKQWPVEDRPREKLLLKGKSSLSDAELISVLLGSGTKTISAVDLARQILADVDHDLRMLEAYEVQDLIKYRGIGEAKATTIVSALELGRRRKAHRIGDDLAVQSSEAVYRLMYADLIDLPHEEFWMILLKRNNEVIKKELVSRGGISGTIVDPKIIFKAAIKASASAVIFVHNHPSGNLFPSQKDIDLTIQLKSAGQLLDLYVLDHIIFSNKGFFSFADESMI